MNAQTNEFEQLVRKDWSSAVFEATARFTELRTDILTSLSSENPEVRSAAVAALNEADCSEAHDDVLALSDDSDAHVQEEVLEYLHEYAQPGDAGFLLDKLRAGSFVFLVTQALTRLCDGDGSLIDDDDDEEYRIAKTQQWERLLRDRGYVV